MTAVRSRVVGSSVRITIKKRGRPAHLILYFGAHEAPFQMTYSLDQIHRAKGNRQITGGTFTLWKPPRRRRRRTTRH